MNRALALARSVRVRAALALGTVLALGTTGTFAYWTDSVEVSGTSISSGSIDLKVNNSDAITTYTDLNLSNMVPGNSTAGVLTVRNAGSVPLTYYADAASSHAGLGANLVVKVTGAAAPTGSGATETCGGTTLPGTGTAFAANLVGSAAAQRTLAPGASEPLCIQATLAAAAPTNLQGTSTNVSFTFKASQVIS